jgi:hypothetical protein
MTRLRRSEMPRSMISATAVNDAMIRNQTGQPAAWMSDNTSTSEFAVPSAEWRKFRESAIVRVFALLGQVSADRTENPAPIPSSQSTVHRPVMTGYPQRLWTSLCINRVGDAHNGLKAGFGNFAENLRIVNIYNNQ